MSSTDFTRDEVDSIYVHPDERFVVSFIVGYADKIGDNEGVDTPEEAAFLALSLTQDDGWGGTQWKVFDRKTGTMHHFDQDQFATWDEDGDGFRRRYPFADGEIEADEACSDVIDEDDYCKRCGWAIEQHEPMAMCADWCGLATDHDGPCKED